MNDLVERIVLNKSYDLYRNTTVALAMFDAIEEMLDGKQLTPEQGVIIVSQFDSSIRKVMQEKYLNQELSEGFTFIGEMDFYRVYRDWHFIFWKKVEVFQHFPPRLVQRYYANAPDRKRPQIPYKKVGSVRNQMMKKNISTVIESVSKMIMISRASLGDHMTRTGFFRDAHYGKCQIVETIATTNPRLTVCYLKPLYKAKGTTDDRQSDDHEDNVIEPPILNRFKNSTMFNPADAQGRKTMSYYSRTITHDPLAKNKYTFTKTFDKENKKKKTS